MKKPLFLLLLVLAGVPASAADTPAEVRKYRDTYFGIDLPQGYLPPIEHVSGAAVSRGFRKPYPGSNLNTVILVTVQEMGPSFAKRLPKERAALTRQTLEPVLESLERNRVGFRKGEARSVNLSGQPGLRVEWSGAAEGVAFAGVVYCVLAGARAYAIQVQDPAGLGNARLNEALQAVEAMRIVR